MIDHTPELELDTAQVSDDPIQQFAIWLDEAQAAELLEPTAMALATADAAGQPSVRMVLYKGLSNGGFSFYTNYNSRKGEELRDNPQAALVFWWDRLQRQIRIEGRVEQFVAGSSDSYFHSRPRISQLAAYTSQQSREVADRETMEQRFTVNEKQFQDTEVPCPAHWGGYRLIPAQFEFWQGRRGRFHDRVVYRRVDEAWERVRLEP